MAMTQQLPGSPGRVAFGSLETEHLSPDTTWMRMRTPSPEMTAYSGYKGHRQLPPPEALLHGYDIPEHTVAANAPVFMQQPYIAYKPVLCFIAMQAPGSDGGDTTIGSCSSGTGGWSMSSGSSGAGCWSPESEQVWEVESGESDLCEVCLPQHEDVEAVTAADAPTTGSIGHPHRCEAACKYIKKPRGCKDGAACTRCHLCDFRNSKQKKESPDTVPAPAKLSPSTRRTGRNWRSTRRGRPQNGSEGQAWTATGLQ